MRPTLLLVGLCCWLVPATAFSQGQSARRIHGTVLDSATRSGIAQAIVFLEGDSETWTDRDGRYALNGVPDGDYLLAVVTRDCRIAVVRLRMRDVESVRVDLEVGLLRLNGASAARTRERAEGTALKVTTREEIQQMGELSLPQILRRVAPSMVGTPAWRPGTSVRLSERGVSTLTGDRTPLMLVDGVRISDIGALESIDPGSVTRIEVAAGSVGGWAQGLEGASGVIHIHTHRGRSAADPYCGATTGRRARSSD